MTDDFIEDENPNPTEVTDDGATAQPPVEPTDPGLDPEPKDDGDDDGSSPEHIEGE